MAGNSIESVTTHDIRLRSCRRYSRERPIRGEKYIPIQNALTVVNSSSRLGYLTFRLNWTSGPLNWSSALTVLDTEHSIVELAVTFVGIVVAASCGHRFTAWKDTGLFL